ncbi:hypothetical protein QTP70_003977 [Hemibagrus guttatus]|uniref:Uncharacterized protein n=1 Tax=Hemibagrus guttatus TaxID=175788 RepID=A0AAE0PPY3_9TELE|nr:hypothetical protein QTP70_003977 [Hemibagrus guttatus]
MKPPPNPESILSQTASWPQFSGIWLRRLSSSCHGALPAACPPEKLYVPMTFDTRSYSGSTGEDSFELHSVDLELEAVEKQIRDLQVKQAQLRQRKAALESSWTDAHLSQVNSRRETITPTTSTPCASLPRPSARTRPAQVSFTPAPGYHAAWMQQQRKTRAKPRARTSPPPPPPVFEIPTQNRFAPLRETECNTVIIRDSIVRHVRATAAKGKVHTRCLPGARVLDVSAQVPRDPEEEHRSCGPPCWYERHQAEADGDPEEGLQEPGGAGTHHIAHDEDHRVRATSHIPARNREVQ